jgi:spermidine synthase
MNSCNEYLEIPCCKGPGQKIRVKDLVYMGRSAYQEIAVYDTEPYGRCLFLDGVIQSSESDHERYDVTILKKLTPADKNLLILGGGDGHTAEMALKLNPEIHVTVVELDGDVVNVCKEYLNQTIFDHPNVNLVIDDAFHFMEQGCSGSYACVISDLTDLPIGYGKITFKDFYLGVFSLSSKILKRPGWISAYMGCNVDLVIDTLRSHLNHIEICNAFIPSFGEPCFFCLRTVPILAPAQHFFSK